MIKKVFSDVVSSRMKPPAGSAHADSPFAPPTADKNLAVVTSADASEPPERGAPGAWTAPSPLAGRTGIKDGVLTAPGGECHNIDPSLADKCALVRRNGKLEFYVLASHKDRAEVAGFRKAAEFQLGDTIPSPQVVDLKRIRAYNVAEVEARMGARGTGTRSKLRDLLEHSASNFVNDIKIDIIGSTAMVRLQKDNSLSRSIDRFEMSAEDANLMITSAFNYGDSGDAVEQPTADQKFTITDPSKLPNQVQTIRGQTAHREDGRRLDLRVIYKSTEASARTLSEIGLLPEHLESLYFVQNIGAGLFTITAPTDNGKSTTLNLFCIDMVQAKEGRIDVVGIDDPVEFMAPEICQLSMTEGSDGEDPFASKVHTSLRLAPHAIKIGECRTYATATAAIDAANTGKLVMTTQHTKSAFGIPFRYERMGIDRHVAFDPETHVCWMSQRLVPALCPNCRIKLTEIPASFNVRRLPVINSFRRVLENEAGDFYVRGSGCKNCMADKELSSVGLKGRILCAEVILPDRELCALLMNHQELEARRRTIIAMKQSTIALHGFEHMKKGLIGVEEYMNALAMPKVLRDDLNAIDERKRFDYGSSASDQIGGV